MQIRPSEGSLRCEHHIPDRQHHVLTLNNSTAASSAHTTVRISAAKMFGVLTDWAFFTGPNLWSCQSPHGRFSSDVSSFLSDQWLRQLMKAETEQSRRRNRVLCFHMLRRIMIKWMQIWAAFCLMNANSCDSPCRDQWHNHTGVHRNKFTCIQNDQGVLDNQPMQMKTV